MYDCLKAARKREKGGKGGKGGGGGEGGSREVFCFIFCGRTAARSLRVLYSAIYSASLLRRLSSMAVMRFFITTTSLSFMS